MRRLAPSFISSELQTQIATLPCRLIAAVYTAGYAPSHYAPPCTLRTARMLLLR